MIWGNQRQGWGQVGQQGFSQPGQQGWANQGHHQYSQGWPTQGQGWGQPKQQGWGMKGQQTLVQQGQQNWGQKQSFQAQNKSFDQPTSFFDPNQDYILVTALDLSMVADVSQANNKTKSKLIIWDKSGDKNQRFRIVAVGNGKYQIFSNAGGIIQVPKASMSNGTQLIAGSNSNSSG